MTLITIIAVLLVSLTFTLIFVIGLKSKGPWGSGWTFFTIVCLWLIAVSLWIPPAAPAWLGAPWIDLFLTALLVSLVLSATSMAPAAHRRELLDGDHTLPAEPGAHALHQKLERMEAKSPQSFNTAYAHHRPLMKTGGLFWMLLLCLCALIIIGAAFPR